MKAHELATIIGKMQDDINDVIHNHSLDLFRMFQSDSQDNEQVNKEADMHNAMVNYIIYSAINSKYKKLFDTSKRALDSGADALGVDPTGIANKTLVLHDNGSFVFTKRQNKDGENVALTDVLNNLARAGVEKAVVDDAVKASTKPKKGNTYYDVKPVEDE
tara:strand:- start:2988 stop:3470 length:483 start_codon:yes stop_codon:yes gene_type:complete